ncbi:MAG: hypothetical protein QM535_18210 [Limnohabitans sp.]|nr:hypothetical protein [Limnohabitans sp.]
MKTLNKILIIILIGLYSCKSNIHTIEPLTPIVTLDTISKPIENSSIPDAPDYRQKDTIENGKHTLIIYKRNKIVKISENFIRVYKKQKLVYQSNDTILGGKKMAYKKEIDQSNNVTLTIYDKSSSTKDYDFIYSYKNGFLFSKTVVSQNKDKDYKENKIFYDDKGQIISKTERNHYAKRFPKDNQNGEITYYYKAKKVYQWAELKKIKNTALSEKAILNILEKSYYSTKNKLIKREFFEQKISTYYKLFDDEPEKLVEEIKLLKTEYYENGKLIKIVESKTD